MEMLIGARKLDGYSLGNHNRPWFCEREGPAP